MKKSSLIPVSFALLPVIGWALVTNKFALLTGFFLIPGSLVSLFLLRVGIEDMRLNDFLTLLILVAIYYWIGYLIAKATVKK